VGACGPQMRRLSFLVAPWLVLASTFFLWVSVARAETTPGGEAAAPAAESSDSPWAPPKIGGFQFLASGGFGISTSDARTFDLSPYGATFGLDVGYTFRPGFRLGAYGGYSLGRTVDNVDTNPAVGRNDLPFTATSSSISGGINVGWDVPLYFLILRYTVGAGITSMKWDFNVDPRQVNWDSIDNPVLGFHVATGVALLWPYKLFEGGIGLDYLIQTSYTLPSGCIGKLIAGVRL
jgi:hypothetical protein